VVSDLIADGVRYDYDEVTEAAHNLRFLIQGMITVVQIETNARALQLQHTDIAFMLSRQLTLLLPVLERRSMRIDSSPCLENHPA